MNCNLLKTVLMSLLLVSSMVILTANDKAAFDDENYTVEIKTDNIGEEMEAWSEEMEVWGEEMEQWGDELERSIEIEREIPPLPTLPSLMNELGYAGSSSSNQKPKLGVYIDDLDFQTAYEMHYDQCYGVLITGVVEGGNADQAGLMDDDIIMEFDGEIVRFEDHLLSLRDSKNIGDTVEIKVFRNEKEVITNLTFGPYEEEDSGYYYPDKKEIIKTKKLSPGFGGGYIMATKVEYDFDEINHFIASLGFEDPIEDAIYFGGGGMGNIGNGWFLGGAGAGMMYQKKIPYNFNGADVQRRLTLESGFGGVTIMKKFALGTERFVVDMGTLIGGGTTSLEVSQSNGSFSWDQSQSSLDDGLNWYAKYEKGYLVIQPSIGALVRIKNWFGIHGSYGYLYTYSTDDDWTEKPFDFTVQEGSVGSPEVINGTTASVGIWFGF